MFTGQTQRSIELYQKQLTIDREIGNRHGEGAALFNISQALDKIGDFTNARSQAEAALTILEQIDDPNAVKVSEQMAKWRGNN